jgi:hypothetical protein
VGDGDGIDAQHLVADQEATLLRRTPVDDDPDLRRLADHLPLHVVDPPEDQDGQEDVHHHAPGNHQHLLPDRLCPEFPGFYRLREIVVSKLSSIVPAIFAAHRDPGTQ